jgi:endonuclease/exonuclease/phosphatase family metal-dependent hydrolase
VSRRRPKRPNRAAALTLGVLAAMSLPASVSPARVATAAAGPARTIKVMTWNTCSGNNRSCKFYQDTAGLVGNVRWYMRNHGTPTDAAILQEFCSSFAKPLEYELEKHYGYGWDVRFAPIKIKQGLDPAGAPDYQCDRGRGAYGIALAVPDENTWWQVRYLPSPDGEEWRVAMCAMVESWRVKLCNAHLSYGGDDPTGSFRAQQLPAYLAYVWPSRSRMIVGGDLNLRPNSTQIAPAYDAFVECAQANQASPRTGPGTAYATTRHDNAQTVKIDYLFTNPGLVHSCAVPSELVDSSDHRPLWITVRLPANAPA